MIIFSHTLTPRLQYVVNFLSQYFSTPIRIICDEEKYLSDKDPHKINYSFHRLHQKEIWIHSHVLLFETAVRQVKVEVFEKKAVKPGSQAYKAFFKTEGDLGFDLLAGTFYLLSRYEEYLPHKKDPFGRYAHENAIAFTSEFLDQPLINIWLQDFSYFLQQQFSDIDITLPAFSFLPTYDIDMAWSFKNKGRARNTGALLKLFFTGKWGSMANRIRVLRGRMPDPYDAYEWMNELHEKFHLQPIYFFLVAQSIGKFDRNIDTGEPEFRQLIKNISSKYPTGLHPSWASGDHPSLLTREKSVLETITDKPVHLSRQHFIRFELPATYRRLIALGITEEYSMGYGTINGFRASIATPFFWYDLKNELTTPLLVHPFAFMEATSYYEEGKSPEEALKEAMHYYEITKKYNGTFITIWHNSFLGTDPAFDGWREAYETLLSTVVKTK